MDREGGTFETMVCVNPLCDPSRATLKTGKFPHDKGFFLNEYSPLFDGSQSTLAKLMGQAGDLTLGGTLDLNDINLNVNGLSGGGAMTNSGDGEVTLTIGDDNADGLTFSGSIGDGTGTTDLVNVGTGLQTLTGVHGLSGMITANAGILVIGGGASNLLNVAGIVVNPGATVRLAAINHFVPDHGTALDPARVLSVNKGSLVMTETIETRVGNVNLSNGATWTVNRGTAAWDVILAEGGALAFGIRANGIANKVTGPGSSTLNGAFTIDTSEADNTSGNTWTLVDIKKNTYGEAFSVTGFTAVGGVHTLVDGANT